MFFKSTEIKSNIVNCRMCLVTRKVSRGRYGNIILNKNQTVIESEKNRTMSGAEFIICNLYLKVYRLPRQKLFC